MRLFLCEKPSQAKDIGKVLGVLGGRHDGYFRMETLLLPGHLVIS